MESPFAPQNPKLLKLRLDQVTVQAELGAIVAYQGDVTFEHAGSGGLGRMLKNLIGRGSRGTLQMAFTGSGWLLVQPSEGRVRAALPSSG